MHNTLVVCLYAYERIKYEEYELICKIEMRQATR